MWACWPVGSPMALPAVMWKLPATLLRTSEPCTRQASGRRSGCGRLATTQPVSGGRTDGTGRADRERTGRRSGCGRLAGVRSVSGGRADGTGRADRERTGRRSGCGRLAASLPDSGGRTDGTGRAGRERTHTDRQTARHSRENWYRSGPARHTEWLTMADYAGEISTAPCPHSRREIIIHLARF